MKTKLKNMLGLSALCLTMFSNTMPTWAGAVVEYGEVNIHYGPYDRKGASGTMAGVRYSADSRQYIGCSLDTNAYVRCVARDSLDNFLYCFSTKPQHVNTVQGMADASSGVFFDMNPGSSECRTIQIRNSSKHLK